MAAESDQFNLEASVRGWTVIPALGRRSVLDDGSSGRQRPRSPWCLRPHLWAEQDGGLPDRVYHSGVERGRLRDRFRICRLVPLTVLIGKSASRITMGTNVRVKPAAWPGPSGVVSFTSMFLARQANRG